MMRRIIPLVLALSLIGGATAFAQSSDQHHGDQGPQGNQGQLQGHEHAGPTADGPRWSRGDRLPDQYRQTQNVVTDWRARNLSPPPRGYRWMCYDHGDCFLVRTTTGVIRETRWHDDRDAAWRQSYSRTYSYNDDIYYRECRNRPDPTGVLVGGLIGGLIGHAVGNDRPAATIAGIIIGGVAGAALTNDMDCNDRNYAYRAYYDGLNSGRAGAVRHWRNPSNNHRGDFLVRSYYYDAHGFQCANYRHTIYLDRRRQANGRACRQPDGAWAFLN